MSSSALLTSIRRLRGLLAAQQGQDDSDEQLLNAFLSRRDENAFAALVGRYGPMVLHVCRRVLGHQQDAEDAFQATFLVLARNAASLRNKTAVASFLHGTAYRMALKAKQSAARRRKHEGYAPARPPADPADELSWREVRNLLDEEIARLPEKYRSVFVLCCLENRSRAEAARRLGLKEGTVSSRLAGARNRLRRRLTRRGVELTALLAMISATESASALPAALFTKAIGGAVSPAVAALADSVSTILSLGKVKLAAVFLLAASVLSGAGLWAYRDSIAHAGVSPIPAMEPPAAQASDKPKTTPPQRETVKGMEIQGRVLDPEGKPKAGAKLLLLGQSKVDLGISGPDGRFRFTVPQSRVADSRMTVVATAKGYGPAWMESSPRDTKDELMLHLVKDDVPIIGQVIDLEGKPVQGAAVRVMHIRASSKENLTA